MLCTANTLTVLKYRLYVCTYHMSVSTLAAYSYKKLKEKYVHKNP